MKEMHELHLPEELKYTRDHEWIRGEGTARIGITDCAQDQLGDIVFVELPEPGSQFEPGDAFEAAVAEAATPSPRNWLRSPERSESSPVSASISSSEGGRPPAAARATRADACRAIVRG